MCDLHPLRVDTRAQDPGGFDSQVQVLLCSRVSVRIIGHADLRFIDGDDAVDLVTIFGLVVADPAGPKVGRVADDRVAILLEPGAVARCEKVLPCRQRDGGVDVVLAQGVLVGEARSRLHAIRSRLPRVHGSQPSVTLRIAARGVKRTIAEHDK